MHTVVTYSPWKFSWICQSPTYGSTWYRGNFTFGIGIDSHPRWLNLILYLGLIELGISFVREAIVHAHTKDGSNLVRDTPRICLRCNKEFMSWGSANRICEGCNVTNANQAKRVDRGCNRGTRSTNKGDNQS